MDFWRRLQRAAGVTRTFVQSSLNALNMARWLDTLRIADYHVDMDIRQITDTYFVAPQIEPDALTQLAAEGFVAVICNRPDEEVPPGLQAKAIETAARAAGLEFHVLALTHQTLNPENVQTHRTLVDNANGKILAYCASGTRSTIAWALGQAGIMSTDDIIAAAHSAGYQLDNMRPTLDAIAARD